MPPPALSLIWGGSALALPHHGGLGAPRRVSYVITTLLCLLAFAGPAASCHNVVSVDCDGVLLPLGLHGLGVYDSNTHLYPEAHEYPVPSCNQPDGQC